MAEAKTYVPAIDTRSPARTYNQVHQPRRYTRGKRRVSIYVCWSFPGEANRDVSELDNRFSTMTEVRRVDWPFWEGPEWSDPLLFQQGIAGALHALRNSLIPLVTGLGHVISIILAGSFLIERVFNIDGMGYLGYTAILQRDYPVALGILVIGSLLMLVGNILSDVIYAVVDPRIRFK